MTTLAESFLADLDDLSDASDHEQGEEQEEDDADQVRRRCMVLKVDLRLCFKNLPAQMMVDDIEKLNYDSLEAVAHLRASERYTDIMQRVRDALAGKEENDRVWTGPSEEDPTYRLLVDCNQLAVDIDNEIGIIHNFMRDKYRLKFPELESLVHHPIDYARVVQAIGNEMDLTMVNLDDVLPQATIMVVSVTASTTSGQPLSSENLQRVQDAAEVALQLDEDKIQILQLVQQKMHKIAPNLSTAVGTEVAARLMGVAGGLINLSKMPACNVQVLGAKRKTLAGFSTATAQPHQGFIYNSDVIQQTPPALRGKASRMVGAKCTLLARMDAYGQDPSGQAGEDMKAEMKKKVEKWQEPAPAKQHKVLPVPDMEPKKRRGGRRFRKMKERYGLTDMRKAANRMNFNQAEEEYMDGEDTIGLGTLGKEGSGRLRIQAQQQKQKLTAKSQKKFGKRLYGSAGGTATSGLSSSLAFTPVQGIELTNPLLQAQQEDAQRSGTESYFSEYSGFRSIKGK